MTTLAHYQPKSVGYTPNARIAVYHIPDKRRRAEAICKHGFIATSSQPPKGFAPCPVCFGRVK